MHICILFLSEAGKTTVVPTSASPAWLSKAHGRVNAAAVTSVGLDEATDAFDEPHTKQQVLAIVDPYIVEGE